MEPSYLIKELKQLYCENAFNPYSDRCGNYDLNDAPQRRSRALLSILKAASECVIDSMWIGQALGHRGGRRTGLAFTDDVHFHEHGRRWKLSVERPTKGPEYSERTAAIIWKILSSVDKPVFLWNIFPLHPHRPDSPFSNRPPTSGEREIGEEFLREVILLLRPYRLIAVGNDALQSVRRLSSYQQDIFAVRHPSYGGQSQFLKAMRELYPETPMRVQRR